MTKVTRTTEGVRDVLFKELEGFLDGRFDKDHVESVTKVTGAIAKTVVLDLEARKLLEGLNSGRDQPRAIGDLNLNVLLDGQGRRTDPEVAGDAVTPDAEGTK